jgi:hypothetical protein
MLPAMIWSIRLPGDRRHEAGWVLATESDREVAEKVGHLVIPPAARDLLFRQSLGKHRDSSGKLALGMTLLAFSRSL